MGRKAMPALSLIQGNKSHESKQELERRQEAEESMAFSADNIKPPTWLRKGAKKHFIKLVKEFEASGLLKDVDVTALALLADAIFDFVEFTLQIEEDGMMISQTNKFGATNSVPHPLLTKKEAVASRIMKLMGDFAMTPSARASIARSMTPEKKADDDNSFSGRV